MEKRPTGPQLFLRYAGPCAYGLLVGGKISDVDWKVVVYYMLYTHVEPDVELLERCFPKAVERLRAIAAEFRQLTWSIEVVAEYWRHRHTEANASPVKRATITGFDQKNRGVVIVECDGETQRVSNKYGIDLKMGDAVYLHGPIIIEPVPEEDLVGAA